MSTTAVQSPQGSAVSYILETTTRTANSPPIVNRSLSSANQEPTHLPRNLPPPPQIIFPYNCLIIRRCHLQYENPLYTDSHDFNLCVTVI